MRIIYKLKLFSLSLGHHVLILPGYGSKFPRNPHHRAASCPDPPAPCTNDQEKAPGFSPHILQGALVGGPDKDDSYTVRKIVPWMYHVPQDM